MYTSLHVAIAYELLLITASHELVCIIFRIDLAHER